MRYVFPESIDDALLARALPRETLIFAFCLRWLHDGRGTFWPAGSGSGMSAEELLRHGPLVVEWLPPIPEDERATALFSHVLAALQSRRDGLDENYAALMTLPKFFTEQNPRANPGSFAVGVAVEFPSTWIDDRLAELDIDRATAKDLVWSDAFKHVQEMQAAHNARTPRPAPEDTKPAPASESPLTDMGCNHDDYCCTVHRHHAMPHRGCIMR